MLENKYINIVIITWMTVAVVLSSVIVAIPQSIGGSSASASSKEEVYYESLLFDRSKVSEINIEMTDENWNWIIENATDEEYRNANITINGETFYNVGIRPKGNSSLRTVTQDQTTNRYSFKIKFDNYIDGQTYHGLDELVVNNMFSDATYMKEYISYDIYEKMGIVTPLFAFTNIKVNNEPWGLYLAVEVTEESFLNRSFGSDYGSLYKPESAGSSLVWVDENHSSYQGIKDNAQTKITDEDFNKVIEMIKHLNDGTDLEKYLDVDQILKYFAINNLIVNLDSYVGNFNHNYMLYEENGVFSVLPWDLNMAFGGFKSRSAQQAVDLSIDTPYSGNASDYPLFTKLIENPEYKEIYYNYIEEAVKLYFDSGLFRVTVDNLDSLINEYVKNDATAFYDYEAYTSSLPVLKEFGKLRAKSVMAQLAGGTTVGTVDLDLSALGSTGGGGGMDKIPNMDNPTNKMPQQNKNAQDGKIPTDMIQGNFPGNGQKGQVEDRGPGENMEKNDRFPVENMERGNRFPDGDMIRGGNMPGASQNIIPSLIITGVSSLVLLIGILFIYKFKRRKYQNGLTK